MAARPHGAAHGGRDDIMAMLLLVSSVRSVSVQQPMLLGLEVGERVAMAAVALHVLGRHAGPACAGLGWLLPGQEGCGGMSGMIVSS